MRGNVHKALSLRRHSKPPLILSPLQTVGKTTLGVAGPHLIFLLLQPSEQPRETFAPKLNKQEVNEGKRRPLLLYTSTSMQKQTQDYLTAVRGGEKVERQWACRREKGNTGRFSNKQRPGVFPSCQRLSTALQEPGPEKDPRMPPCTHWAWSGEHSPPA